MIELICSICKKDWKEVGHAWKRKDNEKIDYYCSGCQSKRKPVRYVYAQGVVVDPANTGIFNKLSGVDDGTLVSNGDFTTDFDWRMGWTPVGPENILVIGDIHEPFCLSGYREFCMNMYHKHNCSHVIFMGDIIDQHHASFHATDPDGLGGGDELDFAISKIQEWYKIFPEADVCLGNHDKIILRKAFNSGISKRWIKDFKDVLGVDWNFQPSHVINNIKFRHGLGMKASPKAGSEMMNVVQGHFHTEAYIHYRVGAGKKIFGAQCPSGIDRKAYAMAYAEEHPKEAVGCMVIKEYGRLPILEMMDL